MTEPIRILQVFAEMNRGGAETMIMNLYRHIDREKIQFDFIVHTQDKCAFDEEIEQLGGRIYRVPKYVGKNHFAYKNAWKDFFISHPGYRIIHGHVRSTASIYLKTAKKCGLITITHSHSTSSRGNKVQKIVKNILQFPTRYISDYLMACSNEAGKWLFGKKFIRRSNFKVINNAINVEKFTFNNTERSKMRKLLDVENKVVIGHVGSFTYPKNHKFLLNVFDEFQKKCPQSVLVLVGDGSLRKDLENQIMKLKLKNKVMLLGDVSNVNDYLQAMDFFVFPSIFEGLGISVIEAQASGLMCLVSSNLPKEVIVTDLVYQMPLKVDEKKWAEFVLSNVKEYKRKNTTEEIIKNKYSIQYTSDLMEEFYIRLSK